MRGGNTECAMGNNAMREKCASSNVSMELHRSSHIAHLLRMANSASRINFKGVGR